MKRGGMDRVHILRDRFLMTVRCFFRCILMTTGRETRKKSLAVLYGICGYLERAGLIEEKERTSVSIENLLEDENSPGKIFGINRITLNDCLDVLEQDGYLKIDRTAGLDTVYFEESSIKTRDEVIEQIYK